MPFFKSMPETAGPGNVFSAYREVYRHWAEMGQALINGPSPLSPAEREVIQACAVARGVDDGLVAKLVDNIATAPIADKWKPLLQFIRKLTLTPTRVEQSDADAVFAAGWSEKALHDAIAVTARMTFMTRIIHGHGFTPMTPERAKASAENRAKVGYVDLYPGLGGKS